MSYVFYNPNPRKKRTADCVIRALTKALDMSWEQVYINAASRGFEIAEMPSAGHVWRSILRGHGYQSYIIPDECPDCYTVEDFCREHREGTYVLATVNHVVTVINGDYYDTWDCGDEIPLFYMRKESL